jgi:hypothetical protein
MAFQVGTQVRPELGRADLSGFERSGQYIGQALANLGQEIGAGIENYQKNKTITATSLAQLEALGATNPEAIAAVKAAGGDLAKSYANIEKGDYRQRDVLSTLGAMQTYVTEQDRQRQIKTQEIEQKIKLAQLKDLEKGPFTARAYTVEGPGGTEVPVLQTSEQQVQQLKTTDASDSPKEIASELVGRFGSFDEIPEEVRNKMTGQEITEARKISKSLAPATSTVRETPAQEAMSEEIGKSIAKWPIGGYAQAQSNLDTYDNLIAGLTSGEYTTRTIADFAPESLGLDDDIRAIVNPRGQAAVDRVRQVLFQGLKDTLGNQFTQREAERLVSASYNPKLEPEENIRRLTSARNVLQATIEAKNAMYEHLASGGSISTYQGVSPRQVLLSGIKDVEQEFASDQAVGGFLAPSGITIRSKRPTK